MSGLFRYSPMNRRDADTVPFLPFLLVVVGLLAVLADANAGLSAVPESPTAITREQPIHLTAQAENNFLLLADNQPAQTRKKRRGRRWFSFNRVNRVFRRIDKKVIQPVFVKPVKRTLSTVNRIAQDAGEAVGRGAGWGISQPFSLVDRRVGKQVRETSQNVLGGAGRKLGPYWLATKTPFGQKLRRFENQFKRAEVSVKNARAMAKDAPVIINSIIDEKYHRLLNRGRDKLAQKAGPRLAKLVNKTKTKVNRIKHKLDEIRQKGRELEERARWITDPAAKIQMETERKAHKYKERFYRKAKERYEKEKREFHQRMENSFQKRARPAKEVYDKVVHKIERGKEKIEENRQKIEGKVERVIDKADEKLQRGEHKYTSLRDKIRRIFDQLPTTPPTVPGKPRLSDEERRTAERDAQKKDEEQAAVDKAVAETVRKAKAEKERAEREKAAKEKARKEREKKEKAKREKAEREKAEKEKRAAQKADVCEVYDPTNPACESGSRVGADKRQIEKAQEKKEIFEKSAPVKLAGLSEGRSGVIRTDMETVRAETRSKDEKPGITDKPVKDTIAEEFGSPAAPAGKPATDSSKISKTVTTKPAQPVKTVPSTPVTPPAPQTPSMPAAVTDFAGTWSSKRPCIEAGEGGDYSFTWKIKLTQTGSSVKGTVFFHNCPCGGRASYSLSGTATASSSIQLKGSKVSGRGPLGKESPPSQTFRIVKNGTPNPNYGPGRSSPCEN